MDPITGLITIVQLIGTYLQEVGSREQKTHEDFMEWLEAHRHEQLKELISETSYLQDQVNILLRDDHTTIMKQISDLSEITLSVAKQLDSLAPIANAGNSERRLPEQAVEVMRSLCKNNQTGFEFISMLGGKLIATLPGGTTAPLAEPEFIDEDCDLLIDLGYLTYDSVASNTRYKITRAGKDFGNKLVAATSKNPRGKPRGILKT